MSYVTRILAEHCSLCHKMNDTGHFTLNTFYWGFLVNTFSIVLLFNVNFIYIKLFKTLPNIII